MQEQKNMVSLKFQLKTILAMCAVIVLCSVVIFMSFHSFFSRPFSESYSSTIHAIRHLRGSLKPIVIFSVLSFIMVSSFLVGLVSIVLLHKVAGPTVRIEKVMDDFSRGIFYDSVRFRQGDQLAPLGDSLSAFGARLKSDQELLRDRFMLVRDISEEILMAERIHPARIQALQELCEEVSTVTKGYRTS